MVRAIRRALELPPLLQRANTETHRNWCLPNYWNFRNRIHFHTRHRNSLRTRKIPPLMLSGLRNSHLPRLRSRTDC